MPAEAVIAVVLLLAPWAVVMMIAVLRGYSFKVKFWHNGKNDGKEEDQR